MAAPSSTPAGGTAANERESWFLVSAEDVLRQFGSDRERGLDPEEAARRLAAEGPNELPSECPRTGWGIFLSQFRQVLVLVLVAAAGASFALGEHGDAAVILTIVVLNAGIGTFQEYRAERAIAALRRLAAPTVRVRRGGRILEVASRDLVRGDLVLLETGDAVPADGRLVTAIALEVEEAALTGESAPVAKTTEPLGPVEPDGAVPLGDRTNLVHQGTLVQAGRGEAVITATGGLTELGRIAGMIRGVEREPTPLQRRLARLGRRLAVAAGLLVALVVALGAIRDGFAPERMEILFLTGVSLAVAAVPEGLPAVVTVTLALGARRMLRRRALVRKLPAVESLGSVTTICSDKTGTLTENRMAVTDTAEADQPFAAWDPDGRRHDPASRPGPAILHAGFALCNDVGSGDAARPSRATAGGRGRRREDGRPSDATSRHGFRFKGEPTEVALAEAAAAAGFPKATLERLLPRIGEIPFSSDRRRMSTLHPWSADPPRDLPFAVPGSRAAGTLLFCKGAVDSLLDHCTHLLVGAESQPIGEETRTAIAGEHDRMAAQGKRILGLAIRLLDEPPVAVEAPLDDRLESGMIFVGMAALHDPPRPEAARAVSRCRSAGIRPIMITGDHPVTALQIARELGIAGHEAKVATGTDLDRTDDRAIGRLVAETSVFARVSPEHKLRIVTALQEAGEVPAMTGDGVNDAPALKKAAIGIAMGQAGTDAAKEAAEMILLDDHFATIVAAVEEGRVIFDNIRKFIRYTLSSNTGEIVVMLAAPLLGMPLPLLPVQILWINLVTDGLPGLALAVEPAERGVMRRPPYGPGESFFSRGMGRSILVVGILMGALSLAVGWAFWRRDPDGPWRSILFTTLTLSQMGNALAVRSDRDPLWRRGLFTNRLMLVAVLSTLALQLGVLYLAPLRDLLHAEALGLPELAVALAASTLVFWFVELGKVWRRLRGRGDDVTTREAPPGRQP